MSNANPITSYVGVDVSKAQLDIFPGPLKTVANQPASIGRLLKSLPPGSHVVCESTGGYERALVAACHQQQIAVTTVNAFRARRFAEAMGNLAKTDSIDARMICAYAQACRPAAEPPADPVRSELADLTAARDNLISRRTELASLREHSHCKLVTQIYQAETRALEKRIKTIEQRMVKLVEADAVLSQRDQIQQSFIGVGPLTSAVLLAYFPELGSLSPKKVAALSGLAPRNNDSGLHKGKRHIKGGRKRVRDALYLAAVTAVRVKNSKLKSFYQRLRDAGKPAKVALIAAARKLLVWINAALAQGMVCDPTASTSSISKRKTAFAQQKPAALPKNRRAQLKKETE